jgi:hypothetical protein
MTHRVAALLAALAMAGTAVPLAADSWSDQAPGIELVVDGTALPRFAHDGRWYVEAHKGREYAIRIRNPYNVRVAVALSVDGLNTIDARHTTAADARKWVLDPYETVTISGWQTSRTEARRFEFTTEERSYGQALGKTADLGVISAVFFRERSAPARETRNSIGGRVAPNSAGAPASGAPLPAPPAPASPRSQSNTEGAQAADTTSAKRDEFAATGMGRRTDHEVTQVWLDLESTPAASVDIRYEFRPQLVKLGILPPAPRADRLQQRERASGFEESGFSPVPSRRR